MGMNALSAPQQLSLRPNHVRIVLTTNERTGGGTRQDEYGFLQVCFLAGLSCAMDPGILN